MRNILHVLTGQGRAAKSRQKAMTVSASNAGFFLGGQTLFYRDRKEDYIRKAYMSNDIVYSIANLITNKVQVPAWGWYTVEDEKAYTAYRVMQKKMASTNYAQYGDSEAAQISKDFKSMMGHFIKGLKPYNNNDRLTELAKYPNSEQTMSDFQAEGAAFKLITGDKWHQAQMAIGGLNKGLPMEINNLPSQHMVIKTAKGVFPLKPASYELQMGVYIPYTKEEILHEKYHNLDWNLHGDQLYGFSPVAAAWRRIQTVNEGITSNLSAYQNGGADGFVAPDINDPDIWSQITETQQGQIKDEMDAVLQGGSKRKGAIAVLNAPWKFTRVRMSPTDLNTVLSEQWNMRMLCNVWGAPSQLLNDPENKIQANASAGERALTTRCAMPLLMSERDSLNRKFQTDWGLKGRNVVIEPDLTCFSELEESKKDMVTWLKDAYWLTPNQKLQMMGEPTSSDPNMDKIYIPNSYVPMDQANIAPDAGNGQADEDDAELEKEGVQDYK